MGRKVVIRKPSQLRSLNHANIRHFKLGSGLPDITALRDELEDMRAVLLGEVEPLISMGIQTLMEVAEAYFSRACDIEQLILRAKAEGRSNRVYDSFRTQEVRSFKEMARSATVLGSRRITAMNIQLERERTGRESS